MFYSADIEFALHSGSRPYFFRDQFPYEEFGSISSEPIGIDKAVSEALDLGDKSLRSVHMDLMLLSTLLNINPEARLDPHAFQELVISICYRLLHRSPLAAAETLNGYDSAVQMGLLALMTTVLFQYGHPKRLSYDLLAAKLRAAIKSAADCKTTDSVWLLWLLFVSGTTVLRTTDDHWLFPLIKQSLCSLQLDRWQDVRAELQKFPWISSLHDRAAKHLWQDITWQ